MLNQRNNYISYIILIFLSFYIYSCTDISKNHTGEKGEICYNDGTCDEGLKCTEGANGNFCFDPCENVACSNHGKCILNDFDLECICDEYYDTDGLNCIMNEMNPCFNSVCQENAICSIENDNAVCSCKEGYSDLNGACIIDEDNPCITKVCPEHSICNIENGDAVCDCNSGYHLEEESCFPSIKQVLCNPQHPENSTVDDTVLVEVKWNKATNSWNEPVDCSWECNNGYHIDNDICIIDENNPCIDKECQENAICNVKNEKAICNCKDGYHFQDENCISSVKQVLCNPQHPDNSIVNDTLLVDIDWNEETNSWNEPADCPWRCNSGYHEDGDSCILSDCETDMDCNPTVCNASTCVDYTCVDNYQESECDDGNFCTTNDSCSSEGVCIGDLKFCDHGSCNLDDGACICDVNYHIEEDICISNTRSSLCIDIAPEHATSDIIVVEINWNEETDSWNETPECLWSCVDGYYLEDNQCIEAECEEADTITKNSNNSSFDRAYQIDFENNSWTQENLNTYNVTTSNWCKYNDIEDWYKITLEPNEYFEVNISVLDGRNGDAVIELYNSNHNLLSLTDTRGDNNATEHLVVGSEIGGTFYIKVIDFGKNTLLKYSMEIKRGVVHSSFIYSFYTYPTDWLDARDHCEEDNGYLITINDELENNFIFNKNIEYSMYETWIGLNDRENEAKCDGGSRDWKWIEDRRFRPYFNWNRDEPDSGGNCLIGNNEDCVLIRNGKWMDENCVDERSYICEVSTN